MKEVRTEHADTFYYILSDRGHIVVNAKYERDENSILMRISFDFSFPFLISAE